MLVHLSATSISSHGCTNPIIKDILLMSAEQAMPERNRFPSVEKLGSLLWKALLLN